MMHTNVPLPEPLYSCAVPDCAGEQSFPADDLYYWDGIREDHFPARKGEESGWYCDGCLDNMGIDSTSALRLDREIERRNPGPEMLEELKEALTILEANFLEPKHRKSMAAIIAKAEGK